MHLNTKTLTILLAVLATNAFGCVADLLGGSDSGERSDTPSADGTGNGGSQADGGATPVTACAPGSTRSGAVAGVSVDYPATIDTRWFNPVAQETTPSDIDEALMKEVGLDPDDESDVRRFMYLRAGFDLRWLFRDRPTAGNWWGTTDLAIYVYDFVATDTPVGGTVAVFDASAMRGARLSGDKVLLGETIRTTVDAMSADRRPKAIIAFAPNRNAESSLERAFVNLFARDVHFATTGSVTISNLRDPSGAPITRVSYPLDGVRTLDIVAHGEIAGSAISASGGCLNLVVVE